MELGGDCGRGGCECAVFEERVRARVPQQATGSKDGEVTGGLIRELVLFECDGENLQSRRVGYEDEAKDRVKSGKWKGENEALRAATWAHGELC